MGITPRDLKPDNSMVDDQSRVKVLDFGLAKLREPVGTDTSDATSLLTDTVTEEGRILGTAAYMAPEQASGRRPFVGDSPISTISAILSKEPESVLQINPSLPRQLEHIIRRCLAKDPSRRYTTAWEVRNELELLQQEVAGGTAAMGPAPAMTGSGTST